jgi:hypothetical protein
LTRKTSYLKCIEHWPCGWHPQGTFLFTTQKVFHSSSSQGDEHFFET